MEKRFTSTSSSKMDWVAVASSHPPRTRTSKRNKYTRSATNKTTENAKDINQEAIQETYPPLDLSSGSLKGSLPFATTGPARRECI